MTSRARRAQLSQEVHDASVLYIKAVLLNLMKGMLQAQDTEERYIALRERIRAATEQEIETLAGRAAEYFVTNANPSLGDLSAQQIDRLKKAAFDHALTQ